MTDRRKRIAKESSSEEAENDSVSNKPTPEEIEIAIYMYDHMQNRDGRLDGRVMSIFKAIEAYDCLAASPYSSMPGAKASWISKKPVLFNCQKDIFEYIDRMSEKGMFLKTKRPLKKIKESKDLDDEENSKNNANDSIFRPPPPPKLPRLHVTEDNSFVYGDHLIYYVWYFDRPVTLKTWIYGILMLTAIVAICFYPVWPSYMQSLAWYLMVLGAAFVGFIFTMGIVRAVLYFIVFILSGKSLTFWLLPNLFEDCGFFASFKPLYMVKYSKTMVKSKSD